MVRVFANGQGDLGSIPGRVIPKTQKMVLDAILLNTQNYKVRIKGKVEQWNARLRVTLDNGRQLYIIYTYIYTRKINCIELIYIYIYIFLLNTLSGGKSCLVAPGVAIPPWATETVLSPWLAADEGRVSHVLSHVVWWKKYIRIKRICH